MIIGPMDSSFEKLALAIQDLPKGKYTYFELARKSSLNERTVLSILSESNRIEFYKYLDDMLPPERRYLRVGDARSIPGVIIDPGVSIASRFAERPRVRDFVRGRELTQSGVEVILPNLKTLREELGLRRPSERWVTLAERGLIGFIGSA